VTSGVARVRDSGPAEMDVTYITERMIGTSVCHPLRLQWSASPSDASSGQTLSHTDFSSTLLFYPSPQFYLSIIFIPVAISSHLHFPFPVRVSVWLLPAGVSVPF